MSETKFLFVDKRELEKILPDLFQILHSNMSIISPLAFVGSLVGAVLTRKRN